MKQAMCLAWCPTPNGSSHRFWAAQMEKPSSDKCWTGLLKKIENFKGTARNYAVHGILFTWPNINALRRFGANFCAGRNIGTRAQTKGQPDGANTNNHDWFYQGAFHFASTKFRSNLPWSGNMARSCRKISIGVEALKNQGLRFRSRNLKMMSVAIATNEVA